MAIDFSNHSLIKLQYYGLTITDVEENSNNVLLDCNDTHENSKVTIFKILETLFVLVISTETNQVITIYTTDLTTINNRRKNGRWICK